MPLQARSWCRPQRASFRSGSSWRTISMRQHSRKPLASRIPTERTRTPVTTANRVRFCCSGTPGSAPCCTYPRCYPGPGRQTGGDAAVRAGRRWRCEPRRRREGRHGFLVAGNCLGAGRRIHQGRCRRRFSGGLRKAVYESRLVRALLSFRRGEQLGTFIDKQTSTTFNDSEKQPQVDTPAGKSSRCFTRRHSASPGPRSIGRRPFGCPMFHGASSVFHEAAGQSRPSPRRGLPKPLALVRDDLRHRYGDGYSPRYRTGRSPDEARILAVRFPGSPRGSRQRRRYRAWLRSVRRLHPTLPGLPR